MKSWSILAVAVLAAAGLGLATVEPPQPVSQDRATLADLAWLQGNWSGDALGGHCEEQWSSASGGSMMGMFRLVAEQKTSLFEFLVIEQEASDLYFRFKHFGPGYVPWEKDGPLEFKLSSSNETTWVFDSPDAKQTPSRLTYTHPDKDKLIITVETLREGSPSKSFDVVLTRSK